MIISYLVLSMIIAYDIYQHSKAFLIAVGLPYSKRGQISIFHLLGSNFLALFAYLQIIFSIEFFYMSFYLILS